MAAHLLDVPTEDSIIGREKEELFVFGYACKVFRDDEKAVYIDKERHLIPWMGDTRLMIDRYDGRGHLYDLSAYDAANVKPYTPSEEEKEIECLCDEERWLELHTDIAEKKMYEEEEWKRYYESLSEGYKAVNFSYDYSSQHDQQQKVPEEPALEEVKPFTVDPDLHVPTDMIVPETEKENVRILKTAKFIANHGSQMEIIIKTKQANNEQFSFLHIDADLYPYYKHVLKMIKSGKYQPKDETQSASDEEDDDNQSHDGYLHPSLTLGKSLVPHVSLAPEVPAQMTIKAPPVSIHETSYGQLIKSITKSASASDFNGYEGHNYPPVSSSQEYPISERTHASSYMSTHDYRHGYSDVPLPPGLEPVTLPSQQSHHASKPVYQMGMDSPYSESESSRDGFPQPSSDSAVSSSEKVEPPPPDIQPIIDRMAMYVARNGEDFEIVVKSKRDPMFDFLEPWHMHYPYYAFKKKIHVTETAKEKKRQEKEKPKTVSFSIKGKPREQESSSGLEKRQVFENDSEDEDKEWLGIPTSFDYNHGIESTEVKPKVSEQSSEEKEKKLADERLRDRLALAAREKLMQNSKQKQMQAERKRKAAMFINMLRSTNKSENSKDEESGRSHSTTPSGSRSQSPAYKDENNKHSSKSRSRNKDSRQRQRSRSRSPSFRRSRSRSPYHKRSRSPSYRRSRSRSPKYSKRMSPSRDCLQYSYSKERSSNSSRRRDEREAQRYVKKRSSSKSPVRIKQEPSFTSMSNVNFPLIKSETATTLSQDRLSYSHLPCLPHTSQQVPPPPPPCPPPGYAVDEDSCTSSDSKSSDSQKASNNYMIQKVRAMLKASRRAVLKEEGFDDP